MTAYLVRAHATGQLDQLLLLHQVVGRDPLLHRGQAQDLLLLRLRQLRLQEDHDRSDTLPDHRVLPGPCLHIRPEALELLDVRIELNKELNLGWHLQHCVFRELSLVNPQLIVLRPLDVDLDSAEALPRPLDPDQGQRSLRTVRGNPGLKMRLNTGTARYTP